MRRASALPHPEPSQLQNLEVVLELGNQLALALAGTETPCLIAAHDFDRLPLQEVLLAPRWIQKQFYGLSASALLLEASVSL